MTERDRLLARVEDLVHRHLRGETDPALVGDAAVDAGRRLLDAAGWAGVPIQPSSDLEAVVAAAWLHWCRADAMMTAGGPGDIQEQEIACSIELFEPVFDVRPDLVPNELRGLLAAGAAGAPVTAADHYRAYERTGDRGHLDSAIGLLRELRTITRDDEPDRPRLLSGLCAAQHELFRLDGVETDLAAAVTDGQQALALTSADDDARAARLSNYGAALLARFECSGRASDLSEAAARLEESVGAVTIDDPLWPVYVANLASAYLARFEHFGRRGDADRAVDLYRSTLRSPTISERHRTDAQANLGLALKERHDLTDNVADLAEAITVGRAALTGPDPNRIDATAHLSLSSSLAARFERLGDSADLAEAESLARTAVAAAGPRGALAAICRANTARIIAQSLESARSRVDLTRLDEALDLIRQAIEPTPAGAPRLASHLLTQGLLRHTRYERTGSRDDLDEAVRSLRLAREQVAPSQLEQAHIASMLSLALQEDPTTAPLERLDEAVDLSREALAGVPGDGLWTNRMRNNLAAILQEQFARRADLTQLDEAVDLLRESARSSVGTVEHGSAMDLLCAGLCTRFEVTGAFEDIRESIAAGRVALALSSADSSGRADRLGNLAAALRTRYEALGSVHDIAEAVRLAREGVSIADHGTTARAARLAVLGGALQSHWHAVGDVRDLDEAVAVAQEAVLEPAAGSLGRAGVLTNLSGALRLRGAETGAVIDLNEGVEVARRAVDASDADSFDHSAMLSNLSVVLTTRATLTRERVDLDEAVSVARTAVDGSSAEHVDLGTYLGNLAAALAQRYHATQQDPDYGEALDIFAQATALTISPARDRLASAVSAGALAVARRDAGPAAETLADAVRLLPLTTWIGLDRVSKEWRLASLQGLGSEAAAWHLELGRAPEAVELREAGSAVLWAQSLAIRPDLVRLRDLAPDLTDRLVQIGAHLQRGVST